MALVFIYSEQFMHAKIARERPPSGADKVLKGTLYAIKHKQALGDDA